MRLIRTMNVISLLLQFFTITSEYFIIIDKQHGEDSIKVLFVTHTHIIYACFSILNAMIVIFHF